MFCFIWRIINTHNVFCVSFLFEEKSTHDVLSLILFKEESTLAVFWSSIFFSTFAIFCLSFLFEEISTLTMFCLSFCLQKNPHLQCFVFHFVLKKFPHYLTCLVSHFVSKKNPHSQHHDFEQQKDHSFLDDVHFVPLSLFKMSSLENRSSVNMGDGSSAGTFRTLQRSPIRRMSEETYPALTPQVISHWLSYSHKSIHCNHLQLGGLDQAVSWELGLTEANHLM